MIGQRGYLDFRVTRGEIVHVRRIIRSHGVAEAREQLLISQCAKPDFLTDQSFESSELCRVRFALWAFPIEVDVVQLMGARLFPGESQRVLQQLRHVEEFERRELLAADCERLTIRKLLQRPQIFVGRKILRKESSLPRREPLGEFALDRDVAIPFQRKQHIHIWRVALESRREMLLETDSGNSFA